MDSNANLVYDWHEGGTLPPLILPVYGKRYELSSILDGSP